MGLQAGALVLARGRCTLGDVNLAPRTCEANNTRATVLAQAVRARATMTTRIRGTVVNVHLALGPSVAEYASASERVHTIVARATVGAWR